MLAGVRKLAPLGIVGEVVPKLVNTVGPDVAASKRHQTSKHASKRVRKHGSEQVSKDQQYTRCRGEDG